MSQWAYVQLEKDLSIPKVLPLHTKTTTKSICSSFELQFPFSSIPLRIPLKECERQGEGGRRTVCHHPFLCELSGCHGKQPSHTCARPSHLMLHTKSMNSNHQTVQQRAIGEHGLSWKRDDPARTVAARRADLQWLQRVQLESPPISKKTFLQLTCRCGSDHDHDDALSFADATDMWHSDWNSDIGPKAFWTYRSKESMSIEGAKKVNPAHAIISKAITAQKSVAK